MRQHVLCAGHAADAPRPALIVCPSTLVAHWPYEISKFVGQDGPGALRVLQYSGSPGERGALRGQLGSHDVVVMAYEALRAGGGICAVGLGGGCLPVGSTRCVGAAWRERRPVGIPPLAPNWWG